MNFCEAVDYVKSLDIYGSVLSLDNMRMLSEFLGHPESELKFIHVTGTNGKGSVCAFISKVLTEAGYRTGAYNSPAVISDIDQYTINTEIISKEAYAASVSVVREACEKMIASGGIQPTRFEVETMVAFWAFKEAKCDLVVLETGLGGRDDATNIVENTLIHVFASISLDHCAVLGNTYAEIAAVKSGIIKNNSPVLLYTGTGDIEAADSTIYDEITNVISGRCNETGAALYTVSNKCISNLTVHNNKLRFSVPELELYDVDISMTGAYQPVNATIALYAIRLLADMGYQISEKNVRKGLKKAKIPFRFEKLSCYTGAVKYESAEICASKSTDKCTDKNIDKSINKFIDKRRKVDIILDGAHNPDGAARLMDSLNLNYPDRKMIFIAGIFKDKDYEEIARITGKRAGAVFAVENNLSARALSKDELASVLSKYNENVITCDSIENAIDNAICMARENILSDIEMNVANSGLFYKPLDDDYPIIVCFGSLSWLNRAKEYIKNFYSKQDISKSDADTKNIIKDADTMDNIKDTDTKDIIKDTGDKILDADKIREGINLILEGIGEDTKREGLAGTPDRVVRMYEEIFSGLNKTAEYELSRTFESKSKDMVVERDITFYSMCEHHLMPFYGKAHIAYIPNGKVVGISKLARCVDIYARKPQIQERLTEEIADAIMEYLKPKGVMVMLEAEHTCMTMRGVKKPGTKTVTVSIRGKMRKRENQDMFFDLVGRRASID